MASNYGKVDDEKVIGQIDLYKEWYGEWLQGMFLDETAHVADGAGEGDRVMCAKYHKYYTHIKKQFGSDATVSEKRNKMKRNEKKIKIGTRKNM